MKVPYALRLQPPAAIPLRKMAMAGKKAFETREDQCEHF